MASKAELETVNKLIGRRQVGIQHLDNLRSASDDGEGQDITARILLQYDINNLLHFGPQERYDLAMQLLTADLLLATFYNSDGDLTPYGKAWFRNFGKISLEDYNYFGNRYMAFNYFSKFISNAEGKTLGVLMATYTTMFGNKDEDPPFIIMPGEVVIDQDEGIVRVTSEDSFLPPWGENGAESVTVYRNVWHRPATK